MNLLWLATWTAIFAAAQSGPIGDTLDTPADRQEQHRVILRNALSNFDEAVALQNHAGPRAQSLYRAAQSDFEALIRDGIVNGRLNYNLANTHMRLGQIGKAIINYRRAQQLSPGDLNIKRNLAFARSLCQVQIPPTAAGAVAETIFFWHFETSPFARTRVALAAYSLCWILLCIRLFSRRGKSVWGWSALSAAVLALGAGASVTWDMTASRYRTEGVIIAQETLLRKGNGEAYPPQLDRPLTEGVEFTVREARTDADENVWYYVELRDGKDGWLRADLTEVL